MPSIMSALWTQSTWKSALFEKTYGLRKLVILRKFVGRKEPFSENAAELKVLWGETGILSRPKVLLLGAALRTFHRFLHFLQAQP